MGVLCGIAVVCVAVFVVVRAKSAGVSPSSIFEDGKVGSLRPARLSTGAVRGRRLTCVFATPFLL